jgi:TRAP transporter TAXI family solute receptor
MRLPRSRSVCGALFCLAVIMFYSPANAQDKGAQSSGKQQFGYAVKRPIFGGGRTTIPWGVVATFVKEAMKDSGWDIQLCRTCFGGPRAARLVSAAAMPPKPTPGLNEPTPPDGPVDFGATGTQFVWWAYQGTHDFASDPGKPQKQLRLVAMIQDPSFMMIAVKADSGITDLRDIKEKRLPVKVATLPQGGDTNAAILAYYGLSKESLASWGGKLLENTPEEQEERKNPDVLIGFGEFARTEYEPWINYSQTYDLNFLEVPKDLREKLVQEYDLTEVTVPEGLFRGVDRAMPGVGRSGEAVYGRTDMPDDLAYTLAKAIDEHKDLLQWGIYPLSYDPKTVWKCFGLPLHPGAARYYREKGYMK